MREHLYRAKCIDTGKWVYGFYFYCDEQDIHYILTGKIKKYQVDLVHPHIVTEGFEWVVVDPKTVGQYTGLKAKSGKKVFEHDIVEFGGGHGYPPWKPKQVVWGNTLDKALSTCCGFMLDGTQMFLSTDDSYSIKVIGNIHDDPELLEQYPANRLCRNCEEYYSCNQKSLGINVCNKHKFTGENKNG